MLMEFVINTYNLVQSINVAYVPDIFIK